MLVHKNSESTVSSLPFPGFNNIRLTHYRLQTVINDDAWRGALGSIKAVYLQTDTYTGWHYIGSAYGVKGSTTGLLHRWIDDAGGNHCGNNKILENRTEELVQSLCISQKDYIEKYFQYSILDIFDMRTPDQTVIQREHWWMKTLDSIFGENADKRFVHGYNTRYEAEETSKGIAVADSAESC